MSKRNVIYFKELFFYSAGDTEEKHETFQPEYPVIWPTFEQGTSRNHAYDKSGKLRDARKSVRPAESGRYRLTGCNPSSYKK
jgi:hypothetical protein